MGSALAQKVITRRTTSGNTQRPLQLGKTTASGTDCRETVYSPARTLINPDCPVLCCGRVLPTHSGVIGSPALSRRFWNQVLLELGPTFSCHLPPLSSASTPDGAG